MKDQSSKIDKETLIPLGLVITIAGFVFWIAALKADVKDHEKQIEEINSTREGSIRSDVKKLLVEMAEVKTLLKSKVK